MGNTVCRVLYYVVSYPVVLDLYTGLNMQMKIIRTQKSDFNKSCTDQFQTDEIQIKCKHYSTMITHVLRTCHSGKKALVGKMRT